MTKPVLAVILLLYFAVMNLLGFYLMGRDKKRAKENGWRTRESVFFLVALLAGGVGCWAGMYRFRHKTKHTGFVVGIPVCAVLGLTLYAMAFSGLMSLL